MTEDAKQAKIVVIANLKGGAGKTTTTMNIAGTLGNMGFRVAVADVDEQGTATRWKAMADDGKEMKVSVMNLAKSGRKLSRELGTFARDYDFILVDCPPSLNAEVTQSALLVADLAIIPSRPSLADIWSTEETMQLVDAAQINNEDLRCAILLNATVSNASLTRDAKEVLSKWKPHFFKTTMGSRQAYAKALANGCTVVELTGEAAASYEVQQLTDEMLEYLSKSPEEIAQETEERMRSENQSEPQQAQ